MNMLGTARRACRALLLSGMVASGLVVLTPDAIAMPTSVTITRSSWAHTDSRAPFRSFVNGDGDAPVGAWRDDHGKHHMAKSYFTFDLAELKGARIFSAEAFASETAANDCTKARATELWMTDTADRPTWAHQPRERVRLAGPGVPTPAPCLWDRVEWDATGVLQRALAAGKSRITLAMRMPTDKQGDVAYGRRYANDLRITIAYNRPPDTPTNLTTELTPCGKEYFTRNPQPELSARFTDPDPAEILDGTFAVWPADQPAQRTELRHTSVPNGSSARVTLPAGLVEDARTYEWQVRASDDDGDTSEWSTPCRFMADFVVPDKEPAVSSVDYPENSGPPGHGGTGLPGEFTLSPNGVADVAGYRYGEFEPTTFVAADRLGGTATVNFAPSSDGPKTLAVQSVDRAGNRSPTRFYSFWVATTQPSVSSPTIQGRIGLPKEFTFTPRMPGVVEYTYQLTGGSPTTIAAAEDGSAAVAITPTEQGLNELTVQSRTRAGQLSGVARHTFVVTNAPLVTSEVYPENGSGGGPGIPGEFVFASGLPDVAEFVYFINGGPEQIVAAGPDRRATITFTPDRPGFAAIAVYSRASDGSASEGTSYRFFVNE